MSDEFRRRMMAITDELHGQGVGRGTAAPPFYRTAWRLGFRIRPPLYQPFPALALGMGAGFAVIYGLLMWVLFWGPEGRAVTAAAAWTLLAGALWGLLVAAYYRRKARRLRLPPLD